jgi:hypothetical protein
MVYSAAFANYLGAVVARDAEANHKLATDILNASLTLMSILVAVIAIVAVQYKGVQSDPVVATPIYRCVVGTTAASIFAGVIAFLSLLYTRFAYLPVGLLVFLFGVLIIAMIFGTGIVVNVLIS